MNELIEQQLKDELSKDWYVVKNGCQLDIHAKSQSQSREFVIASNVSADFAHLIANTPRLIQAVDTAIPLIEAIGTTAAEEPGRIKSAQKWLMEFSPKERQEPQAIAEITLREMTLREYVNQLPDELRNLLKK